MATAKEKAKAKAEAKAAKRARARGGELKEDGRVSAERGVAVERAEAARRAAFIREKAAPANDPPPRRSGQEADEEEGGENADLRDAERRALDPDERLEASDGGSRESDGLLNRGNAVRGDATEIVGGQVAVAISHVVEDLRAGAVSSVFGMDMVPPSLEEPTTARERKAANG